MTRLTTAIVMTFATGLIGARIALSQATVDVSTEISPIAAFQDAFEALAKATDRAEMDAGPARIVNLTGSDCARTLEQLLWYSVHREKSEETQALIGRVIKALGASNEAIIRALVPHLDNRDVALSARVAQWLHGYEDHSAVRPPDFGTYRALIEERERAGQEPKVSLIRHMIQSDAGTGLQTLVRAFQLREPAEIKPILWGEHVLADLLWQRRNGFVGPKDISAEAVGELEKLSRHPRWWVRLYAAEMIHENPELATPEMKDRLSSDAHVNVRNTATGR